MGRYTRAKVEVGGGGVTLGQNRPITGQTCCYGLLGEKIAKSKSFSLHNRAFDSLGLNGVYVPIQTTINGLATVVAGLKEWGGMQGFNVTYPFKEMIIPLLDEIAPRAASIGAVNTVVRKNNGAFRGENTDIDGFIESLKLFQIEPKNHAVLVLGAGGVSRSTCWALAEMGCTSLNVHNRTKQRLHQMKADLGTSRSDLTIHEVDALEKWDFEGGLIINCTSAGADDNNSPWPLHLPFPKKSKVIDLIYRKTRLLQKAKQENCASFNGMEMLIQQAALSFALWTKTAPPINEMKGI